MADDWGRYCGAVPPEGSGQLSTARCVIFLTGRGSASQKHTHRIMGTGFKWDDDEEGR